MKFVSISWIVVISLKNKLKLMCGKLLYCELITKTNRIISHLFHLISSHLRCFIFNSKSNLTFFPSNRKVTYLFSTCQIYQMSFDKMFDWVCHEVGLTKQFFFKFKTQIHLCSTEPNNKRLHFIEINFRKQIFGFGRNNKYFCWKL